MDVERRVPAILHLRLEPKRPTAFSPSAAPVISARGRPSRVSDKDEARRTARRPRPLLAFRTFRVVACALSYEWPVPFPTHTSALVPPSTLFDPTFLYPTLTLSPTPILTLTLSLPIPLPLPLPLPPSAYREWAGRPRPQPASGHDIWQGSISRPRNRKCADGRAHALRNVRVDIGGSAGFPCTRRGPARVLFVTDCHGSDRRASSETCFRFSFQAPRPFPLSPLIVFTPFVEEEESATQRNASSP